MSDRGDYRSLYVAFWDDPDEHALSDRAYRVLTTLKGVLPASGIGVVYELQMCQRCHCTPEQLEAAYRELEQPKPGQERGWIMRERNIVWIVNGLRFEPTLNAKNAKHRAFIKRLLAPLGEKLAIVQAFRDAYPDYLPSEAGAEKAPRYPTDRPSVIEGIDRVSDGSPKAIEGVSKHSDITIPATSPNSGEISARGEMAGPANAPPAPLAGASAERPAPDLAFADLGPDVLRFASEFYGQARSARKQDIARQLIALMNGGVPYKGAQVRAGSLARLQAKCREVLTEGLRDPDKAIAVLLTKLSDVSDDSPTERAAALTRAEDRDSTAAYQAMVDRALAWAAAHPEQAAPIREQLVALRGEPTTEGQRWLFDGEFAARLAPLMAAHPPPA